MNHLHESYAESGVGSIFIYTNEAHPGEHYPHLESMEQKLDHAKALKQELGVNRPILLDALDGAMHQTYGGMPNMSWIISKSGIPVYKSDWTDDRSVKNAVDYFIDVLSRRRSGERLAPFSVERLDFRESDREAFDKGLERNGSKAVTEFRKAFGG